MVAYKKNGMFHKLRKKTDTIYIREGVNYGGWQIQFLRGSEKKVITLLDVS